MRGTRFVVAQVRRVKKGWLWEVQVRPSPTMLWYTKSRHLTRGTADRHVIHWVAMGAEYCHD